MSASLRDALLEHYRAHRRDLPWRRTRDPYAIWVSEIMLQQTQVETVAPRWPAFLAEFPDVWTLARASEARVCEAWAGLGYYRRARHLHQAARRIALEHAGRLPDDARRLRELPGIGRYTAGAIASIAFGREEPLVDGNVTRVLCRIHAVDGQASERAVQQRVWALAEALVRGPDPGDLNQALMDLGATICTPRAPRCEGCPVRSCCAAAAAGEPERYPRPSASLERKALPIAMAWIEGRRGVWLEQRPLDGLWAGLWELPSAAGKRARAALAERFGSVGRPLARVEHTLSHRDVSAVVYPVAARPRAAAALRPYADPLSAPLSALARKAILAVQRVIG